MVDLRRVPFYSTHRFKVVSFHVSLDTVTVRFYNFDKFIPRDVINGSYVSCLKRDEKLVSCNISTAQKNDITILCRFDVYEYVYALKCVLACNKVKKMFLAIKTFARSTQVR